jgi:hypothetical protein
MTSEQKVECQRGPFEQETAPGSIRERTGPPVPVLASATMDLRCLSPALGPQMSNPTRPFAPDDADLEKFILRLLPEGFERRGSTLARRSGIAPDGIGPGTGSSWPGAFLAANRPGQERSWAAGGLLHQAVEPEFIGDRDSDAGPGDFGHALPGSSVQHGALLQRPTGGGGWP